MYIKIFIPEFLDILKYDFWEVGASPIGQSGFPRKESQFKCYYVSLIIAAAYWTTWNWQVKRQLVHATIKTRKTSRIDKPFCWPFKMCTRVVVRWRRSISPTTATRGHTKKGPTKPRCRRDNLVHLNLNHRAADKSHVLDLVDRSYVEIENRIAHMNSITRTQRSTYAWFTL
jgi:hypothetical protein